MGRWKDRGIAVAVLLVLALAPSARANAQSEAADGAWLLVPSSFGPPVAGEHSPSRQAATALAQGLAASPRVVEPMQARARFEQRGSTAPLMVSHSDLDALAQDAQMALYHVAGGLHAKARQDVERALSRADKVLESLNRESLAAQQLLDACLYLVRAYLQSGQREDARNQALECRRLVPDIEPDGTMHPPDVIGVLAEAEAQLRLHSPGSLRVESAPDACAVFVNGRRLGTAPLELPQLGPGEYRIQAECEEGVPGRVHRATIGSTRVVVRIDTRFDAAVQTSLDLSLRYPSADDQHAHAYPDAVEVGRIVGAEDVVLIAPAGANAVVQMERIRVADGALQAAVRVNVDAQGRVAALDAAVRALRDDARVDLTGATPVPLDLEARVAAAVATPDVSTAAAATTPPDLSVDAADEPEDTGDAGGPPHVAGVVLGAAGGAALAAGWALWARQLDLELTYSDKRRAHTDYATTLRDIEGIEPIPPIVAGAGAAVATASLPWLLPEEPSLPVWGAIVGGVGVAVAAGGTIFLVRGANCDRFDVEGRCTDILATTRLGALMLETAVPMLGVPVTYWLRDAFGGSASDVSASIAAGPQGATVRVGGKL